MAHNFWSDHELLNLMEPLTEALDWKESVLFSPKSSCVVKIHSANSKYFYEMWKRERYKWIGFCTTPPTQAEFLARFPIKAAVWKLFRYKFGLLKNAQALACMYLVETNTTIIVSNYDLTWTEMAQSCTKWNAVCIDLTDQILFFSVNQLLRVDSKGGTFGHSPKVQTSSRSDTTLLPLIKGRNCYLLQGKLL